MEQFENVVTLARVFLTSSVGLGLYQFTVMPSGLSWATFQHMMDQLIGGMEEFAATNLDNLVICSSTWEEHLDHLRIVLERLRLAELTAKPSKSYPEML